MRKDYGSGVNPSTLSRHAGSSVGRMIDDTDGEHLVTYPQPIKTKVSVAISRPHSDEHNPQQYSFGKYVNEPNESV
jgi:hypothetical protein